jgi:hypothetical protein
VKSQRYEAFIGLHLGGPVSPTNEHRFRSLILERATLLDLHVNEVLAVRAARHIFLAAELAADVYSRIPVGVRIEMIETILNRRFEDRWPFIVPVLKRVFTLRNQLAHGMPQWDAGKLHVHSFHRGKYTVREYDPDALGWLLWQADVVLDEMEQLWAALVPVDEEWHRQHPAYIT